MEDCDEKSIGISFNFGENKTTDILSAWNWILSKLRSHLPIIDDENEWFDEYSLYTKSTQTLIKTENDFIGYFKQYTNDVGDAVTTPITIPIIVKVSLCFIFLAFFCFFVCLSLHKSYFLFFCFDCVRILIGVMNINMLIIG